MRAISRCGGRWIFVLCAVVLLSVASYLVVRGVPITRLPYHDRFASHQADEWTPYGGFWKIQNDAIVNWSDAQGSKLLAGSPRWGNYQVTADVQLLAHDGDAGLVLRVSDAEIGVDSYRGYYAGIRSQDGALVIGRADHDWLEKRPISALGGVVNRMWYRLHVVAVGCMIAAEVTNLTSGAKTMSALHDGPQTCLQRGQFGLRSTDASAAWRNIQASMATEDDLKGMLQRTAHIGLLAYPMREDDNARMRLNDFPAMFPFTDIDSVTLRGDHEPSEKDKRIRNQRPLSTVSDLRMQPQVTTFQRVHGVVTFISPNYLQDDTGGIKLQAPNPGTLSIGDEVEVLGRTRQESGELVFESANIHLLRDRNAVSPVSITAADAMTGNHEGVLIDIAGEVMSSERERDGTTKLVLLSDGRTFQASVQSDIFSSSAPAWSVSSTVRVRGISVFHQKDSPIPRFSVLVAQNSDVTELAGPSWSRGWRLMILIAGAALITMAGFVIFLRFERSKNKAILQERVRLSHDMHDTLAQSFAGVGFHLQGLRKTLEEQGLLPAPLLEELDIACSMVRETHREASATIAALHPKSQKDGDVLTQLEHSMSSMFDKNQLMVVVVRVGVPRPLQPALTDVLFRVGLEAIANVLRHSRATRIQLSLHNEPDRVILEVQDNGVGFSPERSPGGFGVETMRRRCKSVNARFEIVSTAGEGCTVRVTTGRNKRHSLLWRPQRSKEGTA